MINPKEIALKQVAKLAGPLLPTIVDMFSDQAMEYKQKFPLEQGETHIAGVLHEQNGQVVLVVCAFNGNQITRRIEVKKLEDLIQNIG